MKNWVIAKTKRAWLRLQLIQASDRLKMLRQEKKDYVVRLRRNTPGTPEYRQAGQKLSWYQDLEKQAVKRIKNLKKQLNKP